MKMKKALAGLFGLLGSFASLAFFAGAFFGAGAAFFFTASLIIIIIHRSEKTELIKAINRFCYRKRKRHKKITDRDGNSPAIGFFGVGLGFGSLHDVTRLEMGVNSVS